MYIFKNIFLFSFGGTNKKLFRFEFASDTLVATKLRKFKMGCEYGSGVVIF